MLDKVAKILKKEPMTISSLLFFNIEKLNISHEELYYLIYILNKANFDLELISKELNVKPKEFLKIVNSLSEKNLVKLENEQFNLDGLYAKMAFIAIDEDKIETESNKVYNRFEGTFKRPLTPRELQIISVWLDNYSEELILLALDEATFNQVFSIAYIDRILNNWANKNIKNKDDVERNRENFNKKKEEIEEDEEYDWLNE